MIKGSNTKSILVSLLMFSTLSGFMLPCYGASKKSKKKIETPVQIETKKESIESKEKTTSGNESTVEQEKTYIPVLDSIKKKTFFSSIDSDIVALVEEGTPDALHSAMMKIRKNESEYSDAEKILIQIATEIMNSIWTSQKISWQSYEVTSENAYTGAIQSVKKGVFDSSTGNTDFFTTILPVFVLLYPNSSSLSDYYEDMEKALFASKELRANSVLPDYLLALLYERKGKYSNAVPYLENVYQNTNGVFEAALFYANVLTKAGQSDRADAILQSLVLENPTNIKVLKQCAYTAFENKNYPDAEQYVARVLQQTPNDLEFVLFRAKILVAKNDYIHAVSLLDMYSKQDDSSLDYLLLRAKVQLDWSRNTTAATETVEKTLQKYPSNPDALMMAAKLSSITDSPVAGKYADELASLVLEIDPDNRSARVYALEGLMQRENWNDAYEISSQLIQLGNPDSQLIFNHVKNCVMNNKKTEALETARKFYGQNKTDELISQAYIYANINSGNRDEAFEIVNTMLAEAAPRSKLKSYLYYSRSFLQLSEDAVLADLRSSLIENSRNPEGLLRLYEIYFNKQDYRKAQYYLRQVVAINPNDNSLKKLNEALTQLIK